MADQLALFVPAPTDYVRLKRCLVCGGNLANTYRCGETQVFTYAMRRQGWVKIGLSNDVDIRARDLRAPNRQQYIRCPEGMDRRAPLEIVASWLGDLEHALHLRWAACHAAGEWFLPNKEMTRWLTKA